MARKNTPSRQPRAESPVKPKTKKEKAAGSPHNDRAMRETIESIVIAFILAFLFRTFQAEGYVIPTGSMGPTLVGLHKDLNCPKCDFLYQVGVSKGVDQTTGQRRYEYEAESTTCPMCRYRADIRENNPQGEKYPDYSGDRLQVAKYLYGTDPPKRWDVAVFKYPHGAQTNYIKRLVGMPGETLKIHHGNVYTKGADEEAFEIARKDPRKVVATLQNVYDNDYSMDELLDAGWPSRWQPTNAAGEVMNEGNAWTTDDRGHTFQITTPTKETSWISYRHILPSFKEWTKIEDGTLQPSDIPPPQLITDFYAYNTGVSHPPAPLVGPEVQCLGLHWVGDLAIESHLKVESDEGQVSFVLIEGGRTFQCELDIGSGTAELSIDGLGDFAPKATVPVDGPGTYDVRFANVNDRLYLWIDGTPVEFDAATTYGPLDNLRPMPADLVPLRIGSSGAKVTVSQLRVLRDVYYIATREALEIYAQRYEAVLADYPNNSPIYKSLSEEGISKIMSDPRYWAIFDDMKEIELEVLPDHYVALGDNSPGSMDSRLWGTMNADARLPDDHLVHESLLIGKALFVYWPHTWETPWSFELPGLGIRVPFYPNFKKFRRIR